MRAEKWVRLLVEVLGRAPHTPEEALATLGALLRANPAEKEEFVKEAHEVWVKGTSWEVRGDSSPVAKVVLAALEEATRRLAEKLGWRKRGDQPQIRVIKGSNLWESRIDVLVTPKRPDKEGVFWFEDTLNQKALWAAAYKVAAGERVLVAARSRRVAEKAAHMIATRAARIAARKEEGDFLTMPWGERVRLLFGDRWEDLERLEPRVLEAIRGLREILEEGEELDSLDSSEESEDSWVHQTRVPVWAIRALLEAQGEDLRRVESAYLHDLQEEVLSSFHEEMDVYSEGAWRKKVISPYPRISRKYTWFYRVSRLSPPTYEEVLNRWREFREERKKRVVYYWGKLFPLVYPVAVYEALLMGFADPEQAALDATHHALQVAAKIREKKGGDPEINPLVYLAAEMRRFLKDERMGENGIFNFGASDKEALKKYFAALERGEDPEKAKRLLPEVLREALEAEAIYSDFFLHEVGVDPAPYEPDYDTLLLRRKVEEILGDVRALWGHQGVSFVEALMDGAQVPGAVVQSGIPKAQAEEILAHLRRELEGWAE